MGIGPVDVLLAALGAVALGAGVLVVRRVTWSGPASGWS